MSPSATHLVVIPSYNTGSLLADTVRAARGAWAPVWVVVDGSTDGSAQAVQALAASDPGLRVLVLARNGGKGAALQHAMVLARATGFTHALTMDADGQHPAGHIPGFMAASLARPDAMVLGQPVFGPEAPALRVRGRMVSNALASLETLGAVGDSLCGFRVYPVVPLLAAMASTRWMRRFDFEPEAAVRLSWQDVPALRLPVPVRYVAQNEGGVSHFRYGRDNLLLGWMHARLLPEFLVRLPWLLSRRLRGAAGG